MGYNQYKEAMDSGVGLNLSDVVERGSDPTAPEDAPIGYFVNNESGITPTISSQGSLSNTLVGAETAGDVWTVVSGGSTSRYVKLRALTKLRRINIRTATPLAVDDHLKVEYHTSNETDATSLTSGWQALNTTEVRDPQSGAYTFSAPSAEFSAVWIKITLYNSKLLQERYVL
jgi:hypothetical protein